MKEHVLRLNANEYLPLREVVFSTLRQAIITGEFSPGERLMEVSLARQMGVSRTPVREAIRKLELEGLVTMIPRKGAQVAHITEKSLRDVVEVRMALEEYAVALACERISSQGYEELARLHSEFNDAVNKEEILEIAEKDEHFHDAIFRAAQNERLISIINNLREQFYRYRLEYVKDIRQRSTLVTEHLALLNAIRAGDQQGAKAIMRTHLTNHLDAVIAKIQQQNA